MFPTHRSLVLLAVSLMLGSAVPLMAQTRVTVEAGFNQSTVGHDYDNTALVMDSGARLDVGWQTSFTGGVAAEFPLGSRFRLAPGLRYVQKDNRAQFVFGGYDGQAWTGESRLALDYLALPLTLQARPFASPRIALLAGPEVAYLLSAHSFGEGQRNGMPESWNEDAKDRMNRLDVVLQAGAEYAFPALNHEMFARARYSYGLTSVAKDVSSYPDWSTRGFETLLGMRW